VAQLIDAALTPYHRSVLITLYATGAERRVDPLASQLPGIRCHDTKKEEIYSRFELLHLMVRSQ